MIGFYNASVILTYLGVVSAVFGMSQAFNGNFKIAILCLMISGLTDMYDGTIAKMIKRSEDAKKFGIEIDSLCDLVCFGDVSGCDRLLPWNGPMVCKDHLYVLCFRRSYSSGIF